MADIIQDFGLKIGGARKDLKGNFLVQDVEGMTHLERAELVRKDMVWPTPDYLKMVRFGCYTREAAALIKMLRDAFPAAPVVGRNILEDRYQQACALYVETLNVAKSLVDRGRTVPELVDAIRTDPKAGEYLVVAKRNGPHWGVSTGIKLSEWRDVMDFGWKAYNELVNGVMNFGMGTFDRSTRELLRKNTQWPDATSLAHAWLRRRGFGVDALPEGKGFAVSFDGRVPTNETTVDYYRRNSEVGKLIGTIWETQAEGRSAIEAVAEAHYANKRAISKAARTELLARAKGTASTPPMTYRTGTEWRQSVPATGERYLQDFRMRGGEFGLWVNQAERQQVLDRGYDAFSDLAQACGWTKETVSLGGSLAIAFGSRGQGGANPAAAHYEPTRLVINLTKPHGAGCLAHEWGHAIDHYFGERAHRVGLVAGTAAATGAWECDHRFLSNCTLRPLPFLADSVEANFLRSVRQAMEPLWTKTVHYTQAEVVELARKKHETAVAELFGGLNTIHGHLERYVLGVNAVHVDKRPAMLEQTAKILGRWREPDAIGLGTVSSSETIQKLRAVVGRKGTLSWAENNLRYYRDKCSQTEGMLRAATAPGFEPPLVTTKSAYVKACEELDKGRSKPYYATQHEMFARGFESLIDDLLKESDRHNPFLVHGTFGEAYPAGAERAAFRAVLLPLFKQVPEFLPRVVGEIPDTLASMSTGRAASMPPLRPASMAPIPGGHSR